MEPGSTPFVIDPPIEEAAARRWDQRFRDLAVERAYQESSATSTRRSLRALSLLAVVGWCASFALDRQTAGSEDNYDALLMVRFALGLPVVVVGTALAWVSARWFLRCKTASVATIVTGFLGALLMMPLIVPEPEAFSLAAFPAGTALLVGLCCLWALWNVRFDVLAIGILPFVVAISAAMTSRYPDRDPGILLFAMAASALVGGAAAWLIARARRDAFVATRAVARERERSEALLASMLPASIAERLKQSRASIADHVDGATVLFADLAGFTPLSAELRPAEVVAALDDLFSELDELTHRHRLEKIKTIGDAYMVAGGVPTPRDDHVTAVAALALDMRDRVAAKRFAGGRVLALRIGIDSGPVVAGVLGRHKPLYDLWGDVVNTASRMESHGVPGRIHVTDAVAAHLRDDPRFVLEPRGTIAIKGKGELTTWFVERA